MPIDAAGGDSIRFSPAWDLLCLHAFILGRTGHTCDLIDVRLHESIPAALGKITDQSNPGTSGIAVIHSTLQTLGPVARIVDYLSQHYPDITITLCGPYVSSFPDTINLIPNVQYGLAGDPEIVLRNLLDFTDIEHRLKLVPGLIIPGVTTNKTPNWVNHLSGLSLPEWKTIRWANYHADVHTYGARVDARLSRGNTNTLIDRVFPQPNEPFRSWPLNFVAQLLQKCPRQGISEIFFSDSPGYWTTERILEWCRQLKLVRNSQAWAFQMIPRHMTDQEIQELSSQGCKRIELIMPTCDPDRRHEFGLTLKDEELLDLTVRITKGKIKPQLIYWIQGPGEKPGEADRILKHINNLHVPQFSVYPFPLHLDSLLYRAMKESGVELPPLTDWLVWAQNHDQGPQPHTTWNTKTGIDECKTILLTIKKRITRSPLVKLNRIINRYLPQNGFLSRFRRLDRRSGGKSGTSTRQQPET